MERYDEVGAWVILGGDPGDDGQLKNWWRKRAAARWEEFRLRLHRMYLLCCISLDTLFSIFVSLSALKYSVQANQSLACLETIVHEITFLIIVGIVFDLPYGK